MSPSARTPARPPSRSRMSRAMRRATATSRVTSTMLIATSGLRAPTAEAPSVGCGEAGPASGWRATERAAANIGKVAAFRVGVVVEEHGYGVGVGPPRPEVARGRSCLRALGRRAAERDERHDVERADERVHTFVARDRDAFGNRGR